MPPRRNLAPARPFVAVFLVLALAASVPASVDARAPRSAAAAAAASTAESATARQGGDSPTHPLVRGVVPALLRPILNLVAALLGAPPVASGATTTTTTTSTTTSSTSSTTTTTTEPPDDTDPTTDPDRDEVANYAGQPNYSKLRLTLETDAGVAWAVGELAGVGIVFHQVVEAPPGAFVGAVPNGLTMHWRHGGRAVLDAVVTLPAGADLQARVCKASGGTARLTVTRVTNGVHTAGTVASNRNDDVVVDNCANRGDATLAVSALAPVGAWPVPVDDRRLVLGFYYPWWDAHSFDHHPYLEQPYEPYDTTVPGEVDKIVDLAHDNGVDGFISSYNGAQMMADRLGLLVQRAERVEGFVVSAQLEIQHMAWTTGGPIPAHVLEQWLRTVLAFSSSPAWLRMQGRPVVFMYQSWRVTPAAWSEVRTNLAADGLHPFVVADILDVGYEYDALYSYTPNVVLDSNGLPSWYRNIMYSTRFEHRRNLGDSPVLWAAPVSPGEDDSMSIAGSSGIKVDRRGGARYDETWSAALATRPDWVLVSSWNAMPEDTQVVPGSRHGTKALEQTRSWARIFHIG